MVLPGSQTRRFPSIEVDAKYSCALDPKFRGRCRPDSTRRTRFSYYDPDPDNDCGLLMVSGAYMLGRSRTSSSTTDSLDVVSSNASPSSRRRRSTRYRSLLVQASKDGAERRKKSSQGNDHDDGDTTSDEKEHYHNRSTESPSPQLTLIAELQVAEPTSHKQIDDLDPKLSNAAEGVCDEIRTCSTFAPLLSSFQQKVVTSGLKALAETDALNSNERSTTHAPTVPRKSQSTNHLTRDAAVCTDGHSIARVDDCEFPCNTSKMNSAVTREACQARDSESSKQPRFATLCITFTGLTNEEVEVSLSSTDDPTLDTMTQPVEMIEDLLVAPLTQERNRSQSIGSLATGLCGSSTRVQSQEETLVAHDLHETAVSKRTYHPARMWFQTDAQPFDEPQFIDSIPSQSPPPSTKNVQEIHSQLRNGDATTEMRPSGLNIEKRISTVNVVERPCEPEPLNPPQTPLSATKDDIVKEAPMSEIRKATAFFVVAHDDLCRKLSTTPDGSSSCLAMTIGINATSLSLIDQKLMVTEYIEASEAPDTVQYHQLQASVVPPVNSNNETTLSSTATCRVAAYVIDTGTLFRNEGEDRNHAQSNFVESEGSLPRVVNPVIEKQRLPSSFSSLFMLLEGNAAAERQTFPPQDCDDTPFPFQLRTMDERTMLESCQLLDESSSDATCVHFQVQRRLPAHPTTSARRSADKGKRGRTTRGETNGVNATKSERTKKIQGVLATARHLEKQAAIPCSGLSSLNTSGERKPERSTAAAIDVKERIRRRQAMAVKKHVSLIRMNRDRITADPLTAKQRRVRKP